MRNSFYLVLFLLLPVKLLQASPKNGAAFFRAFDCKKSTCLFSLGLPWNADSIYTNCNFIEFSKKSKEENFGSFTFKDTGSCSVSFFPKTHIVYELTVGKEKGDYILNGIKEHKEWFGFEYYVDNIPRFIMRNTFVLGTCDSNECFYSFRAGSSFNPDDYVKRWNADDLKLDCDFVENHSTDNKSYSGKILFKSRGACPIRYASSLNGFISFKHFVLVPYFDAIGIPVPNRYELKSLCPIESRIWGYSEKIALYDENLLIYMPLIIESCNQSKCFINVLQRREVYFQSPKENERPYGYAVKMDFDGVNVHPRCDFIKVQPSKKYSVVFNIEREGVCKIDIRASENIRSVVELRTIKSDLGYSIVYTGTKVESGYKNFLGAHF